MRNCRLVVLVLLLWMASIAAARAETVSLDIVYTGNEGGVTGSYLAMEELDLFAGQPGWELTELSMSQPAFQQGRFLLMDPDGALTANRLQAFLRGGAPQVGAPKVVTFTKSAYGQFLQWPPTDDSWVLDNLLLLNGRPPRYPDLQPKYAMVMSVTNAAGDRLWLVYDAGVHRPKAVVAADSEAPAGSDAMPTASEAAAQPASASDGGVEAVPFPDFSDPYRWEPIVGAQAMMRRNQEEGRVVMLGRPLGTWDRRMALLRRTLAQRGGALLVGIGNAIDRSRAHSTYEAQRESWEAMKTLPYAAFLPSQAELRLSLEDLRQFSRDFPLVAANLIPPDPEIEISPYRIVQAGPVTLGIIGVVDREGARDGGVAKLDAGWKLLDPFKLARDSVAHLRKNHVGLIVVITDMAGASLQKLEAELAGCCLVVGSARPVPSDQGFQEEVRYDAAGRARRMAVPMVVAPRPHRVGVVRIVAGHDSRQSYPISLRHEALRVGDDEPGDPRFAWHATELREALMQGHDYPMLPDVRLLDDARPATLGSRWRMYSSETWTRLAGAIVRERLGAEVVLLPRLPQFINLAGKIPAYMVGNWLSGSDRLYRIELSGAQLQQILSADADVKGVVASGYDPAVGKIGGRLLDPSERYVIVVSDRVLDNARFHAVLGAIPRPPRALGDLRPLVLDHLEGMRQRFPGFPDACRADFKRWTGDDGNVVMPRWTVNLEEIGVDALSFQNVNQSVYSKVRNTRITTPDNSALGGAGRLSVTFASQEVSWTSRIKAAYKQLRLTSQIQENADDFVVSSELKLNLWRLPLGGSTLALTPYLLGSYDTEFTPSADPATKVENPLQRDLDSIGGLAVSLGGPWQDIKLGMIARYDLSANLFRPGLQLATGFERRLSPQFPVTLKLAGDLRYFFTMASPTPDQLGFLGDLSAALVVPIWQNMNLTLGVSGLVYRGQAEPADVWGLSLNPTIGITWGGVWKPQWGVLY